VCVVLANTGTPFSRSTEIDSSSDTSDIWNSCGGGGGMGMDIAPGVAGKDGDQAS
jgi:hypothetical protein